MGKHCFVFQKTALSLEASLSDNANTGIIAEFKRKSPSKGIINDQASVEAVTNAYAKYGAAGISVLTDQNFFGGSNEDLEIARENDFLILRKDFIIDEYQLLESKGNWRRCDLAHRRMLNPGRSEKIGFLCQKDWT